MVGGVGRVGVEGGAAGGPAARRAPANGSGDSDEAPWKKKKGRPASRPFDFIYVDGGHDAGTALADGLLSFRLLRPGGLIVFDDYTAEVKTAVDALAAAHPRDLVVAQRAYSAGAPQIMLRKETAAGRNGNPPSMVVEERDVECSPH